MPRRLKDSGIPWVGDVPEGWKTCRVGYLMREINRRSITGEEEPLSMSQKLGIVQSKEIEVANPASSYVGAKIVEPGDLVLNKLKAHLGVFAISKYSGVVSPDYSVYRVNEGVSAKYLNYLFHTPVCISEFRRRITGVAVGFNRLYTSEFFKIQIPLPPLPEQKRIADYLDKTVGRIDGLREKISREIERLGDYKKSMISEAVCRGLDKTAKMKDSGIPWVGKIPAGWEVSPLYKYVTQVKNPNLGMREKNLLSLSYGKIKRKDISTVTGLIPASYEGYNIISTGDIVLRLTDLQNDKRSIRVGLAKLDGIVTSAYVTIRPFETCCPDYLAYLILVFDIKKGFYGIGSGVRQGLTYDEIKKLKFIFPPLADQKRIAEYIDKQVAKIDALIEKRKAELERLEALKRSIICECVTGKMEVAS